MPKIMKSISLPFHEYDVTCVAPSTVHCGIVVLSSLSQTSQCAKDAKQGGCVPDRTQASSHRFECNKISEVIHTSIPLNDYKKVIVMFFNYI